MTTPPQWRNLDRKLVAILRGIQPNETADIVAGLIETGFRAIEIPLNSPDPFHSIEIAARIFEDDLPGQYLIGAGTVLTVDNVKRVASCGGNLVVSPNTNAAVIEATIAAGMISMPGVFTPTEAHLALTSGASALKFFPASVLGAPGIAAIRAILPTQTEICAVGGVAFSGFADYFRVGVGGFGLGSNLYKPGDQAVDVLGKARAAVAAYDRLTST